MQISTTPNEHPVPDERLAEILAQPGFGTHFTDHMFTVEWTPDAGWHDARITPYGPLTLDPATAVLHYAQEIFEGMKAYRHDDGSVWTFRPEENAARMVRSSHRLAFPELPEDGLRRGRRRARHPGPALGPRQRGREEPLHPAVHDRLRDVPRRPPRPARHVHGHRLPGRRLLQGRGQAGHAVADRGLHPRRPRRHGGGQDRRQLRQLAGRAAGGHRPGLRPGGVPRRPGGQVRRGARRHEPLLRPRRRPHRHPRDRHHPRGHHPRQHHRARRQAGPPGRGAEVLDRRVARPASPVGRDRRDLRLRHRRGGHPGRQPKWDGGEAPAPASTGPHHELRHSLVDIQYGRAEDTFGWMHRVC